MVPMHLDRPFVPHNLVSAQGSPVPLIKFQMAHRLKILKLSGSKKGTQIYFFFSLKSPGKRTPGSPTGPLWREIPVYKAFLHISRNPHKNSSKYFFLSKALRKEHPSMFPKSGASVEADAHFQSLN
jgi:hypothetical protein